jgi:hypothetical protein
MLPDALPGSCSKGVAGCRHGGKSELTGLGITRGAALGNRTPIPTHYERGPEDEVADGWCLRALGYSFQSVAGDGDDGRSGAQWGTGGRTSDVNDADVVCIRAIESEKASP